jgi:transposase-like protein
MSIELPTRPTCPACGSTKVGTLAKEITKDTAWRCASCGETFKAPKVGLSRGA